MGTCVMIEEPVEGKRCLVRGENPGRVRIDRGRGALIVRGTLVGFHLSMLFYSPRI